METTSKFLQFFMFMGPWKWPLILLALIVFVLICFKFYEYFIARKPSSHYLDAILFWGSFSAIVGITGQVSGLWEALNMIIEAADVSPSMVLIGFLSSFVTTLFGLFILVFAAICWWGLKYKYSRLLK